MSEDSPRLSVLLLADDHIGHANTILEHIGALRDLSRHDVVVYNPRGVDRSLALDFDEFDVVVLHYTLVSIVDAYLSPGFRRKMRTFGGLKVQLIQDDYRWVNDFHAMIRELGITVLFTLVPERELDAVWPPDVLAGVERITTLAGYVPLDAGVREVPRLADRPLDIVYRGRTLPYWIGRLGQEKAWIAQGVLERADRYGLRVDVDWREGARIYGTDWLGFMSSGRATLGTESGATITDFDGSIERDALEYLRRKPGADYESVHREILAPHEGNVMMNIVSPRVFEAIALRTALVLFPGEYSRVVEPDRHYIPLAKDFSNFDEVAERLRDMPSLEALTERAYEEIIASGRYSIRRFVERFDQALDEHAAPRTARRRRVRFAAAQIERPVAVRVPAWQTRAGVVRSRVNSQVDGFPGLLDAPAKVVLSMGLANSTPSMRPLLRRYLRCTVVERKEIAASSAVFEDLLKLGLAHRLRLGTLPDPHVADVVVRMERSEDELVMRSLPIPSGSVLPDARSHGAALPQGPSDDVPPAPGWLPSHVSWDHSAVGSIVRWPVAAGRVLRIAIGEPGREVHEFRTFGALGERFPDEMSRALR